MKIWRDHYQKLIPYIILYEGSRRLYKINLGGVGE